MLKDIIMLEVNGKKNVLGQVEIETPSEFMFSTITEQILNCHIFEEFIDEIFIFTIEHLTSEFEEKIKNVYITFIGDDDEFICSIVIDRFKPKKEMYRMRVVDWQATGKVFKYVYPEDEDYNKDDLKPQF